jgi:RNase adaptor protein for sRNA GlmZ degradation
VQSATKMDATVVNGGMVVVVSSFAFKTGTPEANLVLDVRFLPDPRPLMEDMMMEDPSLDGTHDAVEGFIREQVSVLCVCIVHVRSFLRLSVVQSRLCTYLLCACVCVYVCRCTYVQLY